MTSLPPDTTPSIPPANNFRDLLQLPPDFDFVHPGGKGAVTEPLPTGLEHNEVGPRSWLVEGFCSKDRCAIESTLHKVSCTKAVPPFTCACRKAQDGLLEYLLETFANSERTSYTYGTASEIYFESALS